MLDRIVEHMFDLLENDPRILTGGFPGVTRVKDDTDTPVGGNVNIYDYALEDDSVGARPSIYFGTRLAQGTDRRAFDTVSSMSLANHRVAVVPIVICCVGTRGEARQQRRQLVANVRAILTDFDSIVQDAYWYLLQEMVDTGGFKNSGGGNRGTNEARILLNFEASYVYVAGSVVA